MATTTATLSPPAASKTHQVMPGSFSPEDYIEFHENPFDDVEKNTKDGESVVVAPWSSNLPEVDVTDIKWHEYQPPAALRRAPHITSQVLVEILYSSIENVRAHAIEEYQKKLEAEEELRKQNDEAKQKIDKGKGKEPYLPIIIQEDKPAHQPRAVVESDATSHHSSVSQTPSISTLESRSKPGKRRMLALRKFFLRSNEKGESSATGSAIESLRRLHVRASSDSSRVDQASGTKTESTEPTEPIECVSCLDDFEPKQMIKAPCHYYCQDCFIRLVTAAVQNEQQWPPKCCLNPIPVQTILRVIPSDLKKTFQDRSQEWDIPIADRIYCGHQRCSLLVKPSSIDPKRRQGSCANNHTTCTICRGPGHKGKDCERDPDMELTNALAEDEGWKRCLNCQALVEHREACQHMTCRCGTQFCYVCGQRWRTCDCTMDQLNAIKTAASTRREQRQFREQVDAEELRQILLQIEEYEREEALKAEMLRQEQERLEEERRQREIEERVRQESIRRRDIELKYEELRTILYQLHDLQLVLLEMDQSEMENELAAETKAVKAELAEKQKVERADEDALMMTKLSDKEYALNREFQIRAAEENDIEEAFLEKLKEYWKDRKDGESEIDAAMLLLRRQMDKGYSSWQKWKKGAMEKFEEKLKEDLTLKEELMYSTKARLDDQCEEKARELARRKASENKWLEMVIVEREKLLNVWEVQEVEGDADSIFDQESDA